MQIELYTKTGQLNESSQLPAFEQFLDQAPTANYFQSPDFFRFIATVNGYKPLLLLALDETGAVAGSVMGVIQSDGKGLKSWFSRRLIVWGGPILRESAASDRENATKSLLNALKKYAQGKAIFIEFRNFFDCTDLKPVFEASGFDFRPHLNFLVKTDDETAARGRLSSNRRRQIKTTLAAGAIVREAESEAEVLDMYAILERLYREKVKKPLPSPDLFVNLWKSPHGKVFVVLLDGKVLGGSLGPTYRNKILYQWYVCGENGVISGVHPSVLASWAPIEYGARNGYQYFDFMGAGRPDDEYGVREFKARFGGEEVCFGRFEKVLSRSLYRVGKLGLKVYQTIR